MTDEKANGRMLAQLLAIVLVVGFFWNSKFVWPLRILVVFFHEISHGAAAILTGGSLDHIELVAQEGGLAWCHGGSLFLIYSAGYLGSMLWGSVLLVAAARTRYDRQITFALGAVLGIVTLWYVRTRFGFLFGLTASAALLACGRWLEEWMNDLLLKVVGLTSCLYAVWDIWSDVITRSIKSDASYLADLTHVPAKVWGVAWILLSVACAAIALRIAAAEPAHAKSPLLGAADL
ncbi:MAG: M50 family metallopeptidase [Elusimicrobia bacterium]|nr:M50 family metallopeptidase [Elusimicrobiota bacterium]